MLVVDNSNAFFASFIEPFKEHVFLPEDDTDNLRRLDIFFGLLFPRPLRPSSEDKSEPDSRGEGDVKFKSSTNSFTSCLTFLAASQVMGAIATASLATAEAITANEFGSMSVE